MAQWIQTNEPYIKVHEIVKSAPLNPTVGEDLIIGVVLISDAGPSVPTLINGQKEFLATYASKDITQEYIKSLQGLYEGADKEIPSTMWANAYRLAGSNTMLVCRASKANNIYFSKPLVKGDLNDYILRDGLLLKKMAGSEKVFKFVLDIDADNADHDQDGWGIAINGTGVLGNRTTDDGAQYDYFINNLPDLVDQLNETSKFFSPAYKYYTDVKCTNEILIDADSSLEDRQRVMAVMFDEVYLGSNIIDTADPRYPTTGYQYILPCLPNWETTADTQMIIDLNGAGWSGFEEVPYYATNQFNSSSDLKVRIRRFNHDAVINKTLSDNQKSELTAAGQSPYTVLTSVLDTYTKNGTQEPSAANLERDFFEIAVQDPSVNSEVSFFNVGNIIGRGDMEVSEINSLISMIQLELPDNLHDLGLNYYGYESDDLTWVEYEKEDDDTVTGYVATVDGLWEIDGMVEGVIYGIGTEQTATKFYKCVKNGEDQLYANLTIDPTQYKILQVSDSDLKKALDQIAIDEVYITEGLCDLGNTEPSFQSYMANYAINNQYFYNASTVNSTNYMTIGADASKLSQDSYRVMLSAPWDIDTNTLGWKFYASPSVLYWETVSRNRRNNEEFRATLGSSAIAAYQRPVTEFNKKTRQLLLSKKVNTVKWNIQDQTWNWNENTCKYSSNDIMSEECNSRLALRIAKAMPRLLWQYIGRQISQVTCDEMKGTIDYFFKTVILPMGYTVNGYRIFCPYDAELARQNKVHIVINVRFFRSLKYVDIWDSYFDTGMEIDNPGYDAWGSGTYA